MSKTFKNAFIFKNVCGLFHLAVKNIIHEEVSKYENQYRGKELLGFVNYKTFETIVQQYIQQLVEPALSMLQKAVGEGLSQHCPWSPCLEGETGLE